MMTKTPYFDEYEKRKSSFCDFFTVGNTFEVTEVGVRNLCYRKVGDIMRIIRVDSISATYLYLNNPTTDWRIYRNGSSDINAYMTYFTPYYR